MDRDFSISSDEDSSVSSRSIFTRDRNSESSTFSSQGQMDFKEDAIFQVNTTDINVRNLEITTAASANKIIVMGCKDGTILRTSTSSNTKTRCKIHEGKDREVVKMFLDPTGNHLIVTCKGGYNYYNHFRTDPKKFHLMKELKNITITCIAWGRNDPVEKKPEPFLIGTNIGTIYYAIYKGLVSQITSTILNILSQSADFNLRATFKTDSEIKNIMIQYLGKEKLRILILTAKRFLELEGGPTLSHVFDLFNSIISEDLNKGNCSNFSFLPRQFTLKKANDEICYLNGNTIRFGHLDENLRFKSSQQIKRFTADFEIEDLYNSNDPKLNLNKLDVMNLGTGNEKLNAELERKICGCIITEYHIIVGYTFSDPNQNQNSKTNTKDNQSKNENKKMGISFLKKNQKKKSKNKKSTNNLTDSYGEILIFSQLTHKCVERHKIKGLKELIMDSIFYDPILIYIVTQKGISLLISNTEKRDLVKQYLENKNYPMALRFAKTKMEKQNVYRLYGYSLFKNGSYELAAEKFTQSDLKWETVALLFLELNDNIYLISYLTQIIEKMHLNNPKNKQKFLLVSTWILELYLRKFTELELQNFNEENNNNNNNNNNNDDDDDDDDDDDNQNKNDKIIESGVKNGKKIYLRCKRFLQKYCKQLNSKIVYKLLESHNRINLLIQYCIAIENYEKAILILIQEKKFDKAIKYITQTQDPELFYKYSYLLIGQEPNLLILSWIQFIENQNKNKRHKKGENLNCERLIPSIDKYLKRYNFHLNEKHPLIEFFSLLNPKNQKITTNNYLISFYLNYNLTTKLHHFIYSLKRNFKLFDPLFTLNICKKKKYYEIVTYLYSLLPKYKEAIEYALKYDHKLALKYIDEIDDKQLKTTLLLKICEHLIKKDRNITRAVEVVGEYPEIRIDDFISILPGFVKLNDFKMQVKESLIEHTKKMQILKYNIKDSNTKIKEIHHKIKNIKNLKTNFKPDQNCSICKKPIGLSNNYYIFKCNHIFHENCLKEKMINQFLSQSEIRQVKDFEISIKDQNDILNKNPDLKLKQSTEKNLNKLKNKYDQLIAPSCVLCGNITVDILNKPFTSSVEEENSWKL
ncbi:vacuolar protein sorting-associated protein 18 [Anaeramoeba flamelloides]|uniref:Vacuolar protein sorting-associated protein 18 n=1 Tax=Anaeramoeba flamelloides TaxID=1746091 RepID=A0AAV7YGX7_9EUKA|nr:vacuolar protein sorting-associated protein 18 [Anaeramoeba flamelloides]